MHARRFALALPLFVHLVMACGEEQPSEPIAAASTSIELAPPLVDQALLADLLGEAVEVAGDQVSADGLLVRLAFEPLIRQTGPVSLQLVQSTGYRLLGVAEGSPLWQLGLREGDVLTSVDGGPIVGHEHELRSRWEGRPVASEIGYLRGSEARTLSLRIRSGAAWRGTEAVSTLVERTQPNSEPALALDSVVRCEPGTTPDVLANCEIDRSAVDPLRADPSTLVKQVRIVPRMTDGEASGFKLYGIRSTSLVAQVGLQNGDTLMAIDGTPLTSLESFLTALQAIGPAGAVTLTIERRGATQQLNITIVDAAK